MKFYYPFFVAAILTAGTIKAQHVNLGIKGGLNLYTIKNNNGVKYDTKAGVHTGLLAHIHITREFAVQPELLYSAQGAKYTSNGAETKLRLGYLNIPVMFQYMFDNGFRIEAGPQVGLLLSAKSVSGNTKTDFKNNLKKVDFALGIGTGYIHQSSGLGFDARYNVGVSNINENSSVKSMNRGFQLGIFYQFRHMQVK